MSCTYYKNIKTRNVVLLIILIISTNSLLGANFFHEESEYNNAEREAYWGVGRVYGNTTSTIYRTNKDVSISYTTTEEVSSTYWESDNWAAYSQLEEFHFFLESSGNSGVGFDFIDIRRELVKGKNGVTKALQNNVFGYDYMEYVPGGMNLRLHSKLLISIPAGTPDGTYTVGSLKNLIHNNYGGSGWGVVGGSVDGDPFKLELPYTVKIITLPNFTVVESDIDFGRIPIDTTTAQEAFGRIEFKINNELNDSGSFTATYPSTVNMTNSSDSSTVPLNIELLNGSETGPVLGTNFSLSSDTDIYVKATLPPSSITNKSTGIYSGSLTISIDYN